MFTADQLVWLFGTDSNDTNGNGTDDRNAAHWAFAKWPGNGNSKIFVFFFKVLSNL